MCMSLDLGKWEASCTGAIAGFGRMGACPWDQQRLPCIGFAGWHRKSVPIPWQMARGLCKGHQGGEDSWVVGADHGKEMAACTL